MAYPQDALTSDQILNAMLALGEKLDALTAAIKANTTALAVGQGAPHSGMDAASYLDADSGDVYTQQQGTT